MEVAFDIGGDRNLTVKATETLSGKSVKARLTSDWLSKVNYEDHFTLKQGADVPMTGETHETIAVFHESPEGAKPTLIQHSRLVEETMMETSS